MSRRDNWFPFLRRGELPANAPISRPIPADPFDAMLRAFDDPFFAPFANDTRFVPSMEVSEDNEALHVMCELPGLEPDDVDVSLQNNVLRIRGEKRGEERKDRNGYHYSERKYGAFERAMRVPPEIEADKVLAKFDNGVLRVTLPKTSSEKQATRKISVRPSP
jgi:HSP20 family protein